MASSTEPRSGIVYGWDLGESDWKDGMDDNMLLLGRALTHLSVIDRDLTAPPGGESAGDTYIVGDPATGDWAGQEHDVAVYDGALWQFYTPRIGYLAYIEDEEKLSIFKELTSAGPGGWSAGVAI